MQLGIPATSVQSLWTRERVVADVPWNVMQSGYNVPTAKYVSWLSHHGIVLWAYSLLDSSGGGRNRETIINDQRMKMAFYYFVRTINTQ